MGAALVEMVARLTLKSRKYETYHVLASETADNAAKLRSDFLSDVTRDAEDYAKYLEARRAPKNKEALAAGRDALKDAITACVETPLGVAVRAAETLRLAEGLLSRYNENTASDLDVAAQLLLTSARGAACNVRINLPELEDSSAAREYLARCEAALQGATASSERISRAVSETMERGTP
jgi:formiminotetrahydrofolate cyclodeaminase